VINGFDNCICGHVKILHEDLLNFCYECRALKLECDKFVWNGVHFIDRMIAEIEQKKKKING